MTRTDQVDPSATCLEVSETLSRGGTLSREAAAHAGACPVCRALVGASPSDMEASTADLLGSVLADIDGERGLSATLRSLSTGQRVLAAAFWSSALVALVAFALPRWHRAAVPVERVVLVVTVLAALLAVALRMSLRPLFTPPPTVRAALACFLGGLGAPFLFALLPISGAAIDSVPGVSPESATEWCFAIGAFVGLLVVLGLRALDRGVHASRAAALFAATAGGLAANAALELHCPITARAHLLIGHAGVALALVLAYGVIPKRGER